MHTLLHIVERDINLTFRHCFNLCFVPIYFSNWYLVASSIRHVKEEKDTGGQKNPVNEFFWILHILYPWVLLTKYQFFRIGFQVTF